MEELHVHVFINHVNNKKDKKKKLKNSLTFDKQVNEVNDTGYVLDLLNLDLAGADVTLICDGVNSIYKHSIIHNISRAKRKASPND